MSTPRVRFVMIGGFLGAGKTTTIARLAKRYVQEGKRVAIVTNDQAHDLVDTGALAAEGFDVGEVPGACFCCKFNDLVETAEKLTEATAPEVIIAEPVGSCTDLIATVIEPLRRFYGDAYEVSPLATLVKPEHGLKILRGEKGVGFSPKAAYIFLKQIEEADLIVVNKIDKLAEERRRELVDLLGKRYPGKPTLLFSARTGDGFEALVDALAKPAADRAAMMEVDYDVYAEGEAELGWLNCIVGARKQEGTFSLDQATVELVSILGKRLAETSAEPAHLKALGQGGEAYAMANLVSSDGTAELSHASGVSVSEADLIVNARVATAPEDLERVVRDATEEFAARLDIECSIDRMQRFRPGRPVPTHRVGA